MTRIASAILPPDIQNHCFRMLALNQRSDQGILGLHEAVLHPTLRLQPDGELHSGLSLVSPRVVAALGRPSDR